MKRFWFGISASLVLLAVSLFSEAACTPQEAKEAKAITQEVLTEAQRGCVFFSPITDASALADFCHVVAPFLPVVRELIGAREDARRAGLLVLPTDGGAPLTDGGSDAGKRADSGKSADSGKP